MPMKIGRLLAIIVHCMFQIILDCCNSSGPDILTIIYYYQKTS